jgi:predicted Zn-dependent protease
LGLGLLPFAQKDDLGAKIKRARELTTAGNYEEAIRSRAYDKLAAEAYSRLADLPPSAEWHEVMAKIYFAQRRCLEASKEWQEALKFSNRNPYYQKELAISLTCAADYENARRLLDGLTKESPGSAELNYWLGLTLMGLKKEPEAVAYLEKAVEIDPTVPGAHRELARAYLHVGQAEKAIPHLKAALPFDKDGSVYFQLARAYQSTGQQQLAKESLKKFQEIQNSENAERKALEQQLQITPP